MKKTFIAIIIASAMFGCSKEKCKTCYQVSYSDELKSCGRANNGFEEFDTRNMGEFCEDELIQVLRDEIEKDHRLTASCGNKYTVRIKLECK